MTTAAQTPESATGTEGHSDYLTLKSGAASETQSSETAEAAPAPEPEETTTETKGLTDEEKSERKRRNDERRERRWYQERGEMRAQMRQLQAELEDLRSGKTREAERPASNGEPVFDEYLQSGKFKTYEAAQQAFMRDSMAFMREQIRNESQTQSAQMTEEQTRKEFNRSIREFSKTHGDFDDAFDAVVETLGGGEDKATPVTTYLVKAKDAPALIYHLGNNPELLEQLADMGYEDAIAEIGAIRRELKAAQSQDDNKTKTSVSRPAKSVAARGTAPDSLTAMRQAAEKNDFTAFRQALRAQKK